MIYTLAEQAKLRDQSRLKDLYTNDYLNDEFNANFKIIKELYFNNNTTRTKAFNVGTNLFSTVTDTISYFVGNPILDIKLNLADYTKDLISVGKAVFGLKRVDNGTANGELKVYYIPAENHLISDGLNKVYTMYKNIEDADVIYYTLKQVFTNGTIENTLYKMNKIVDTDGMEVPLDSIKETAHLKDIMQTGLDVPAIFYTEFNEIDGIQSELDKIKNLVYSLDRKAVMFETQFLGEIEQFKIFENIHIPECAKNDDGTVSLAKLPKVLATDTSLGASGDIKYISNENKLIDKAIDYETKQIQKISSATAVPLEFLGENTSGSISGTSRELMLGAFVKKIEFYREKLTEVLTDILELFEGETVDGKQVESYILWSDVISKSDKELVEELEIALNIGIISKYTGIQKYLKLKESDDIAAEIKLIQEDLLINQTNNESEIQSNSGE